MLYILLDAGEKSFPGFQMLLDMVQEAEELFDRKGASSSRKDLSGGHIQDPSEADQVGSASAGFGSWQGSAPVGAPNTWTQS